MFSPVLCAVTVLFMPILASAAPSVQLTSGTVEGIDTVSKTNSQPLVIYYGIPFAEPPVGSLRFRAPQVFRGSNQATVISSTTYRSACMQSPASTYPMSEDCLYLNIYAPAGTEISATPKKVMVYIHGGGFQGGDAILYKPTDLVVDYDVMVITVQYRLGVLGFLSSGDEALPGNNGLRDQAMALRWVKANIGSFNGDANDVTIFGVSAGSLGVSILSLSPETRGLFTKAIMHSGTAMSTSIVATEKLAAQAFKRFTDMTDCKPWIYNPWGRETYHASIVDCMRTKSVGAFGYGGRPMFSPVGELIPVVDGTLIPTHPHFLLNNRTYLQQVGALDRDYVIGTTNNEGLLQREIFFPIFGPGWLSRISNPGVYIPQVESALKKWSPLGVTPSAMDLLDYAYSFPRDENNKPSPQARLNFQGDTGFVLPAVLAADALLKASPTINVYFYLFDHSPELADGNTEQLKGTPHAADMAYLFDTMEYIQTRFSSLRMYSAYSQPMFGVYRSAVSSFAKTGNPSGNFLSDWPRYEPGTEKYAALDVNPEVRQYVYADRMALWREFMPKHRRGIFSRGRY